MLYHTFATAFEKLKNFTKAVAVSSLLYQFRTARSQPRHTYYLQEHVFQPLLEIKSCTDGVMVLANRWQKTIKQNIAQLLELRCRKILE